MATSPRLKCCCREAAKKALQAYDGNMQVGGGVNADNAAEWLDAGASHVIVTSYIFPDGQLSEDRLKQLVSPCCTVTLRTQGEVYAFLPILVSASVFY